MEILLLGVAWSLQWVWMLAGQREYLRRRRRAKGLNHSTAVYGGLLPISVAGLLLGLSIAWAGSLKTLGVIILVLLASWAMNRIKKAESGRTLSSSSVDS